MKKFVIHQMILSLALVCVGFWSGWTVKSGLSPVTTVSIPGMLPAHLDTKTGYIFVEAHNEDDVNIVLEKMGCRRAIFGNFADHVYSVEMPPIYSSDGCWKPATGEMMQNKPPMFLIPIYPERELEVAVVERGK